MEIMNRCNTCVTDKSLCDSCIDNPKYKDVPRCSQYREYNPTCPRGYDDCIYDPAYIKYHNPKWYNKLYGDKTPEKVSELGCKPRMMEDPDENNYCYDNEDL